MLGVIFTLIVSHQGKIEALCFSTVSYRTGGYIQLIYRFSNQLEIDMELLRIIKGYGDLLINNA